MQWKNVLFNFCRSCPWLLDWIPIHYNRMGVLLWLLLHLWLHTYVSMTPQPNSIKQSYRNNETLCSYDCSPKSRIGKMKLAIFSTARGVLYLVQNLPTQSFYLYVGGPWSYVYHKSCLVAFANASRKGSAPQAKSVCMRGIGHHLPEHLPRQCHFFY